MAIIYSYIISETKRLCNKSSSTTAPLHLEIKFSYYMFLASCLNLSVCVVIGRILSHRPFWPADQVPTSTTMTRAAIHGQLYATGLRCGNHELKNSSGHMRDDKGSNCRRCSLLCKTSDGLCMKMLPVL